MGLENLFRQREETRFSLSGLRVPDTYSSYATQTPPVAVTDPMSSILLSLFNY